MPDIIRRMSEFTTWLEFDPDLSGENSFSYSSNWWAPAASNPTMSGTRIGTVQGLFAAVTRLSVEGPEAEEQEIEPILAYWPRPQTVEELGERLDKHFGKIVEEGPDVQTDVEP